MTVQFVNDSAQLRITVIKRDTSTLLAATFFAGIIEKEINFTSNNGETSHYDVFRRAFFGSNPLPINLPTVINDSLVITKKIAKDANWNESNVYAISLLQNSKKEVLQAQEGFLAKNTGAVINKSLSSLTLYPNPFTHTIRVVNSGFSQADFVLYDMGGKAVVKGKVLNGEINNLQELNSGTYILKINCAQKITIFTVVKQL